MFPITHEEMHAMHAEREREVARLLLEQARSEVPVVGTFVLLQARRLARALFGRTGRRIQSARRVRVVGRQHEAV